MAVDPRWLRGVREKNRERFGMPGMDGLGQQDIVEALQRGRGAAVTPRQKAPPAPKPGSPEAILKAFPLPELPPPEPIPAGVWIAGGLVAAGLLTVIGLALLRR